MDRLLSEDGEVICRLEALDFEGSMIEPGTAFSAVISGDAGTVIRMGAVLLEIGDGSRHPGVIDHAEVVRDSVGPVVKIRGVLGSQNHER